MPERAIQVATFSPTCSRFAALRARRAVRQFSHRDTENTESHPRRRSAAKPERKMQESRRVSCGITSGDGGCERARRWSITTSRRSGLAVVALSACP